MKKIYALLVVILVTFSCSTSDDFTSGGASLRQPVRPVTRVDPTKLARVVFYPGTTHERHWYFYPNGLLKKIVQPNGTLIQNFIYDANQNLINTQFFGDPFFIGTPYSYTFTYDGNNRMNSINGNTITYNSATNTYTQGSYIWFLNSESLMTGERLEYNYDDIDENGNPITVTETVYGLGVGYNNNNLTLYSLFDSPSSTHYLHDANTNPFKLALLPICRALQLTHFNSIFQKWVAGEYTSQNNIIKRYYDSEDPESDRFEYTFNSNNLPVSQTRKSYSFNTLENTTLDILYYYQGDAIP